MRTSVAVIGLVLAGTSAFAVGCGGAGSSGLAGGGRPPGVGENGCGRIRPGVGAKPLRAAREGSAVALAKLGDRTIAYVADEDDANVHTVDVATGMELGTTPLKGAPSQILVAPDGRVVVALKDKAALEVLEPGADVADPLASRCVVPTASEPLALALTPDDASVVVTSGWGSALSAYDLAGFGRKYEITMPREPRAVVISDDGKKAFVAHVVGSRMSVVDLETKKVAAIDLGGVEEGGFARPTLFGSGSEIERRGCQGFALAKSTALPGRIFAPEVLVDPGRVEERTEGYGNSGGNPPEVAAVAVIDEDTQKPLTESLSVKPDVRAMMGVVRPLPACLLPRAATIDASTRSLFVACVGIDSVVEYDAGAADPTHAERRRFPVAAGPTALAVDPVGHRLIVFSQFDRTVHVVSLAEQAEDKPVETTSGLRVALSRKAQPAALADLELGRKLFHTSSDPRISRDGRACASCHPDGRDDALTWATPDGPRQTPMLAGRLEKTAPYGWMGSGDSVEAHLGQTFARLGGTGLSRRELDALISFATSLRPPAVDTSNQDASDKALVERGKELFHSSETACGSCHGESGSWTDHAGHDVKSKAQADVAASFDTPSLRFVGGTAPYFHDGRYPTLRSLLLDSDGKMGKTKHLAEADLNALEAYMRTL